MFSYRQCRSTGDIRVASYRFILGLYYSVAKNSKEICPDVLKTSSFPIDQRCPFSFDQNFHVLFVFLPFPKQALVFTCLQYKSFENTVGKGEIARYEQLLLFPQCFLATWRAFCHFYQTWNCCLQTLSVWKSLKFVIWERVKLMALEPKYRMKFLPLSTM